MTATLAILTLFLAATVFTWGMINGQRRQDAIGRALQLYLLVQATWLLVEVISHAPLSAGRELIWLRVRGLFWMTIGFVFLHAVYRLIRRPADWLYALMGGLAAVGVVLFAFTDLGVAGYFRQRWGVAEVPGALHTPLLLGTCVLASATGLVLLFQARRHAVGRNRRRAYTVLLVGGTLGTALTWATSLLVPAIFGRHAYPHLGAATTALVAPFIYGAVVRYEFLGSDLEELASELFVDSPEGLLLLDPDGIIRGANPAALALLGPHCAPGQQVTRVLEGVVSEQDFAHRLYHHRGVGGDVVLSVSQATQMGRSSVRGRVLVIEDVTHQEELSAVLERSRDEAEREVQTLQRELAQAQKVGVIGTLAGGIAHDFNNLLGVVHGFASITYGDLPAGHPAREKLSAVLEATEKAQEIVIQILAFTRREPPQRRAIAAHWVVDEVLKLLEVSLPATIHIHRRIDADAGTVMADQQQLKQVILNLVTNAFQVMGPDGGELLICLDRLEVSAAFAHGHPPLEPGPHVVVSVQDSGPGMDEATQAQIFEPFFSSRPTADSTGLGLPTARHIVRDHGGVITVESALGEGATFNVYLPVASPGPRPG